jgi:hypothetical protein
MHSSVNRITGAGRRRWLVYQKLHTPNKPSHRRNTPVHATYLCSTPSRLHHHILYLQSFLSFFLPLHSSPTDPASSIKKAHLSFKPNQAKPETDRHTPASFKEDKENKWDITKAVSVSVPSRLQFSYTLQKGRKREARIILLSGFSFFSLCISSISIASPRATPMPRAPCQGG